MDDSERVSSPWPIRGRGDVVLLILLLVFGVLESTRTARENTSPPATTGMAPRTVPPSGEPSSTTGQRPH
jgi:hypothetical protein